MINDCDENDNGPYTITVDQKKSSTAEVIVDEQEEKSIRSPSPQVQSEEPSSGGFRVELPKELKVNEGDDLLLLQCEVYRPDQITHWYLDDDLIDDNHRHFQISNKGTLRQLKGLDRSLVLRRHWKDFSFSVLKAELNDTGKYSCVDQQTGDTTTCDVDVQKAAIRLVKGLPETLIVPQGNSFVRVSCVDIRRARSRQE